MDLSPRISNDGERKRNGGSDLDRRDADVPVCCPFPSPPFSLPSYKRAFSKRMYGTLVCQVSSYYRRFPDDLRHLKILVRPPPVLFPSPLPLHKNNADLFFQRSRLYYSYVALPQLHPPPQIKIKMTDPDQTSTVGIVINVNIIWYYCIQRGIGVDPHIFSKCDHW